MGKINLFVHPLFFLFGLYYALTGRIFLFVICTVSAVIHELGHSYVASSKGYKLNKITLMPFGAVVSGDIDGLKPRDEIIVALAGPFINLAVGIFFVATWWIFPESYVFTQPFFQANASMACVNLMPFYPLDGGRVVTGILQLKRQTDCTHIVKKVTMICSLLLFVLFVLSLFTGHNLFSLGLFSAFLFSGVLTKSAGETYVKTAHVYAKNYFLAHGMEKKTLVFATQNTLADVAKRMQGNYLYALEVVNDDMQVVATFSIADLERAIITKPLSTQLKDLKRG